MLRDIDVERSAGKQGCGKRREKLQHLSIDGSQVARVQAKELIEVHCGNGFGLTPAPKGSVVKANTPPPGAEEPPSLLIAIFRPPSRSEVVLIVRSATRACASVRLDELFESLPSWDASCSGKHRIATAAQALQRHPRGNPANPLTSVFLIRSPDRPNPLGLHRTKVLEMHPDRLHIGPIKAIDGTPVIDIKPVVESSDY
jgi:hypothetical protein